MAVAPHSFTLLVANQYSSGWCNKTDNLSTLHISRLLSAHYYFLTSSPSPPTPLGNDAVHPHCQFFALSPLRAHCSTHTGVEIPHSPLSATMESSGSETKPLAQPWKAWYKPQEGLSKQPLQKAIKLDHVNQAGLPQTPRNIDLAATEKSKPTS